jgi:hypothetical protein
MKIIITISLIAALTSGCVSLSKPAETASLAGLNGKTMVYTSRDRTDFIAVLTPIHATPIVGGALIATEVVAAGRKIRDENNISDPSTEMGKKLAESFAAKYNSKTILLPVKIIDGNVEEIVKNSNGAKYAVDVQTKLLRVTYIPTLPPAIPPIYSVNYMAMARLINLETKKSVAEHFCNISGDTNQDAPTYDEMMADGASVLKEMLNHAVTECLQEIRTKAFKT